MDDLFAGEARVLRERIAQLEDRLDRLAASGVGGTHRMVGRVFSQGAIPTTAGKFYACHPVTIGGPEVEGGTPVRDVDTAQAFLVDLLGGTAAVGDDLVCRRIRHRWVSRPGGGTVCKIICVPVSACGYLYPDVTLNAVLGGSTVATGVATNQADAITVTNNGTGYTSVPTAVISGDGTGATATVVLNTVGVSSVTLTNAGSNYVTAPAVTATGSTLNNNATITAKLAAGPVVALTLTAPGTGYTPGTGYALGFTGGGGTGVAGTFDVDATGAVVAVHLTAGGANYTTGTTLTFPGAGGTGATGTGTLAAQPVASIHLDVSGSGYTTAGATVTIAPPSGGGTTATATATLPTFVISFFTMTNRGTGYTTGTVAVSGGGGTGGAGTLAFKSQVCFNLTAPGSYTFSAFPPATAKGSRIVGGNVVGTTVTCDGGNVPQSVPNALPIKAGYFCCGTNLGCGPYPATIYVTDAEGTRAITTPGLTWSGSFVVARANVLTVNPATGVGTIGPGNVTVHYSFFCDGTGTAKNLHLQMTWKGPTGLGAFGAPPCSDFTDETTTGSGANGRYTIDFGPFADCVVPLNLTGTFPSTANAIGATPCGGNPIKLPVVGSVTLTE